MLSKLSLAVAPGAVAELIAPKVPASTVGSVESIAKGEESAETKVVLLLSLAFTLIKTFSEFS